MKQSIKKSRIRKDNTIIPEELLPQFDIIQEIVLGKSGFQSEQLTGTCRKRELVDTRRAFISMALRYCTYTRVETHKKSYKRKPTLHQLGKYLGGRDHSSIHNLIKNLETLFKYDKSFDKLHTSIELEYTNLLINRH